MEELTQEWIAVENPLNLKNKIILITGASGGIGKSMAVYLARLGATPILHYNSNREAAEETLKSVRQHSENSNIIQFNIRAEQEVRAGIKYIKENYGRIDCLVNNAGILTRSFIGMHSLENFAKVISTNLIGNFCVLKYVTQLMINQKYGSIVNVSSVAGMMGLRGQSAYSSSKGALNSLTVVAAKELALYNVRVNGVAPGYVATGMLEDATTKDKEHIDSIPLKRFGKEEEIASSVAFLLSDAASYITGHTLIIDGGLSINI